MGNKYEVHKWIYYEGGREPAVAEWREVYRGDSFIALVWWLWKNHRDTGCRCIKVVMRGIW